ncbi:MAG TPA: AAA family ATPase [Bryobacteraceae bacterium]|nr:AAA family ATPase [Bryobacteraceae bacterium]
MLLRSITLRNLLSFKDVSLELGPLNVLIGPNGSGKSNLMDAISLLQAAPVDLNRVIVQGGGIHGWIWNGVDAQSPTAFLECDVQHEPGGAPLSYGLSFSEVGGFVIHTERLQGAKPTSRKRRATYFDRTESQVVFNGQTRSAPGIVSGHESVLSRYKNPVDPTPTTRLGRTLEQIRIYRELRTSSLLAQARTGTASSSPKEFLEDGGGNLAVVLKEMEFNGTIGPVNEYLNKFCPRFKAVRTRLDAGILRVHIAEEGLRDPSSSFRLSDGTLKFLCILAILLNPNTQPLVCIDEPELGLHPDAIYLVAQAIVKASQRTQLIVTTHSDALIDALSDRPESVLLSENDAGSGTRFERLSRKRLKGWLDRYTLGEIWRKGEIGGNL